METLHSTQFTPILFSNYYDAHPVYCATISSSLPLIHHSLCFTGLCPLPCKLPVIWNCPHFVADPPPLIVFLPWLCSTTSLSCGVHLLYCYYSLHVLVLSSSLSVQHSHSSCPSYAIHMLTNSRHYSIFVIPNFCLTCPCILIICFLAYPSTFSNLPAIL